MGHGSNDKLFITPSEHSGIYGQHGATSGKHRDEASVIVPYHMCALTHQPWTTPACIPREGHVYEKDNLLSFLHKYGVSPASGEPTGAPDVLTLHFARNERGKFHDPVSQKEFTDHSHIVAIRTSGNTFLHETVQRLNVKAKLMRDLVSDEHFAKGDIIRLQDPHDPEHGKVQSMYHARNNLTLAQDADTDEINTAATGSTKRLLKSMRAAESNASAEKVREPARTDSAPKAERYGATSTGMTAASFTSSSLTPRTKTERVAIDEEEIMFEQVAAKSTAARKVKGLVRLSTNYGPLNLELHVDKAPKTCYNFLMLCRNGTYDNTVFHRNIPGFMIQGGDPTGTGRGGESIWGEPFWDELIKPGAYRHTGRGTLSMANKGPNTNGSQFFIAYRATPHLDTKHTVFGQLLSDDDRQAPKYKTLNALEHIPNEAGTDRPQKPIRVVQTDIFEDPFAEWRAQYDARLRRENPDDEERARREAKRRKREDDRTTWLGTKLADDRKQDTPHSALRTPHGDLHGLKGLGHAKAPAAPKARPRGGFGDFAGW